MAITRARNGYLCFRYCQMDLFLFLFEIFYSTATAEPPLCLSIVVPLAIRNALASARLDAASTNAKWFPIGIVHFKKIDFWVK